MVKPIPSAEPPEAEWLNAPPDAPRYFSPASQHDGTPDEASSATCPDAATVSSVAPDRSYAFGEGRGRGSDGVSGGDLPGLKLGPVPGEQIVDAPGGMVG